MDGLTRDSKPLPNGRARASVLLGLLSVAALPAGVALAERLDRIELLHAAAAIPLAAGIGIAAVLLARRARHRVQYTLGRVGGSGTASVGRWLGLLGVYLALIAALSLGFFGLLELFAS